jgi:hypothetical protein
MPNKKIKAVPARTPSISAVELAASVKFSVGLIKWLIDVTGEPSRAQIGDITEYLARHLRFRHAYGDGPEQVRQIALEITEDAKRYAISWEIFKGRVNSRLPIMLEGCKSWR